MLDKAQRRMTPEEFYAWQEAMDEKYELVDGYPVPRCPDTEMMTGARRRHDQIVWNVLAELKVQLRGKPCRGFTSDTAVKTAKGRRRPDAGIECGELHDESFEAGEVRMVAEVLSPSTRELDMFGKLDEYKAIESMDHVLLIEPNEPRAILWSRQPDRSWNHTDFQGIDAEIEVRAIGITLRLEEVYSGLKFRSSPTLSEGGDG